MHFALPTEILRAANCSCCPAALSVRNAGYLVYRSDQLSLNSRLFRDRLVAHGVHAVDLTRLAEQKSEQSRHENRQRRVVAQFAKQIV